MTINEKIYQRYQAYDPKKKDIRIYIFINS